MFKEDIKFLYNNNNLFNINVYIPIGSINETNGIYGISHFLEHIKFNKSKKYSTDKLRNKLSHFVYNAYTTLEHTKYYITSHINDYERIVNIINEIIFNTEFNNNEIELERKIVLEEEIYTNDNNDVIKDLSIYKNNNPYKRVVIGKTSDIKKINNRNLKKYNEQYFNDFFIIINCPKNYENRIKNLCIKKFPKALKKDIRNIENIHSYSYELIIRNLFNDKQALFLSFNTIPHNHKYYIYMEFINFILSYGKNSKISHILREKKGLIYIIETTSNNYKDNGFYIIKIITRPNNNIIPIINIILKEIEKLKTEKISNKELKNFKERYNNYMKIKCSDMDYYTKYMGNIMFYNREINSIEYIDKSINKLESSDINDIFSELFNFNKMNVVLYGKYNNIDNKNKQIYRSISKFRNT